LRAKLAGLLVTKQQIEVSGQISVESCTTEEEIIQAIFGEIIDTNL
jgi:hypothetical protein